MQHIAIFASGSGTNAEKIIAHFKGHSDINVALILCNKPDAYVLQRAKNHHIPYVLVNREGFYQPGAMVEVMQKSNIDFIVLAGFMWLIPADLTRAFDKRMINIHPALLPRYGGKGMYGNRVHEAVVAAGETETGISIHWVNEHYDEGDIIFQKSVAVSPDDDAEAVAEKVHALEYECYPGVIENILKERVQHG
ncbi:MAG: phosphoribosylglycinamide formyltransferase [Flavobacteriales bacterium]|nr:phosphoribosylglycinamide formyltransferase [Flavobacteriales bacterium]